MHFQSKPAAKLAAVAALACLTANTSFASSKDYMYAADKGGEIMLHPDGSLMKISGRAICTRNCREFDNFLETVTGLGLITGAMSAPNTANVKAPDVAYIADDQGAVISIYGVPMTLERDPSRDSQMADIAGKPDNAVFFAFKTLLLGPEDPSNVLPLSSSLNPVFVYSQAGSGPKLAELGGDPMLVLTDTVGEQGGTTTPASWSIKICESLSSSQIGRNSTAGTNSPFFLKGTTSGPVIGKTWDPVVRRNSTDSAATDILLVSASKIDRPMGSTGSLLVDAPYIYVQVVAHARPFTLAIPNDCSLVGTVWTSQAGTSENDGSSLRLYNALDLLIGAQ